MTTTTSAPATRFTYSTVEAQNIPMGSIIEVQGELAKVINRFSSYSEILLVVTFLRDNVTRNMPFRWEQDVFLMVPVVGS